MVSFENFVKSMPCSLSELKVIPSFCFAFKIPDDVTASNMYSSYGPAFSQVNDTEIQNWEFHSNFKPFSSTLEI